MARSIIMVIVMVALLTGCSVMILNHSHGNKLAEETDPQTEAPIKVPLIK